MGFFWICVRVNVNRNNKMVTVTWSPSSYQKFNIWETLSISFACVWAPSIDVTNTESRTEHSPSVECNTLTPDVVVETGLCGHGSLWFYVTWPAMFVHSPFSCDRTLARNSLNTSWISMTLMTTPFLPGAAYSWSGRTVERCRGLKVLFS